MGAQRYWFLAPGKEDTPPEAAISVPWWPEVQPRWVHSPEYGPEYLEAPMLFTTEEAAEEERRHLEDTELESYLDLVERYGEENVNEAYDNTLPLRVFGMSRDELLDKLENSDFLCVMVDDKLKLRGDLVEELKRWWRRRWRRW